MLKKAIILFILLLPLYCKADIYQQTDANGNIIFSDEPQSENAQPLNITDTAVNAVSTTEKKSAAVPVDQNKNADISFYGMFTIVSPRNEETFQNPVSIPVQISLDPRLKEGDRIQIYVDGKAWHAAVVSTQFSLNEIERGSHQIQAKIIDQSDNAKQESNIVTIYVQRTTILIKKPMAQ